LEEEYEIEGEYDFIQGEDWPEIESDADLENMDISSNPDIQGFWSSLKKAVRKSTKLVKSVSKIPVLGAMIPPQVTMGASFLNSLTKAERRTGRKVKFGTSAVKSVYGNAFLRGRLFERKRMIRQLKRG